MALGHKKVLEVKGREGRGGKGRGEERRKGGGFHGAIQCG